MKSNKTSWMKPHKGIWVNKENNACIVKFNWAYLVYLSLECYQKPVADYKSAPDLSSAKTIASDIGSYNLVSNL
jgi:hypothetical protein